MPGGGGGGGDGCGGSRMVSGVSVSSRYVIVASSPSSSRPPSRAAAGRLALQRRPRRVADGDRAAAVERVDVALVVVAVEEVVLSQAQPDRELGPARRLAHEVGRRERAVVVLEPAVHALVAVERRAR